MASKRQAGTDLLPNPFIKRRNLAWTLDEFPETVTASSPPKRPLDSHRAPSPPQQRVDAAPRSPQPLPQPPSPKHDPKPAPSSAAIESGKARITNHAEHFASLLSSRTLCPFPAGQPRLPTARYRALFDSSLHSASAAHFVIHQHDHPVAGTHYDLRLQINPTSSASWAVMYGPPGVPNGARLNRNATETRVHCLWNHLVETGAAQTGSLLIWDTGTYEVLPTDQPRRGGSTSSSRRRRGRRGRRQDPPEPGSSDDGGDGDDGDDAATRTEQQKLAAAFAARKIRVRLNGARLPRPYVLYLRLTKDEDAAGRAKAARSAQAAPRRRRRRGGGIAPTAPPPPPETSSSGSSSSSSSSGSESDNSATNDDNEVVDPGQAAAQDGEEVSAMDRELRELEDAEVRRTNAYPGATNSIGSVHQRRWYLSMDREASGFVRRRQQGRVLWEEAKTKGVGGPDEREGVGDGDEDSDGGPRLTYPFYVRGVEHERSVVTGRLGADILRDEGVTDYVGRVGWRPVLK